MDYYFPKNLMSQISRYQKLAYNDSISKSNRYPSICKELSFLLRTAYSKFPKYLQTLIFQDVLRAFNLLPGLQTRDAVSAAHLLYQSADASLPKQRKNLAATEFKQAMIALKRRSKPRDEDKVPGSVELPQDVLGQIFGLLDLQSLIYAGLVCWSWNSAANSDELWRVQYITFFWNSNSPFKIGAWKDKYVSSTEEETGDGIKSNWKEAFRRTYRGMSVKNMALIRGYCETCATIVWLENMNCSNEWCQLCPANQKIKAVSLSQVLNYIMNGWVRNISNSDSESDSDEDIQQPMFRYVVSPESD